MGVIYTIAHPITNYIVYVGASENLSVRINLHTTSRTVTPIALFIKALKENYLLPKVEIIENCDLDELMYFERYWIHQLQCWGFDLLNQYKKPSSIGKNKAIYIKKTPEQWAHERRIRNEIKEALNPKKIKKWDLSSFAVGKTYKFYNITYKKHHSFRTSFYNYMKRFGFEVHLVKSVVANETTYTVCDGLNKFMAPFGIRKGGTKRYKPLKPKSEPSPKQPSKLIRYHPANMKVGDTLTIPAKNNVSFKNSIYQFNKFNDTDVCYNYNIVDDIMHIEIVERHNLKRGRKLSNDVILSILADTRSVSEIAKSHNLHYSTVYNYKRYPKNLN